MAACIRIGVVETLAAILAALAMAAPSPAQASRVAYVLELTGPIRPGAHYLFRDGLRDARAKDARLVILRLDTPGGSEASTREMIKTMSRTSLPVVVHVAPDGAAATSAGVFLTIAADVAAMAPGTNIGSATPVRIGPGGTEALSGDVKRKAQNDAAAFARALAETRGRNASLADRMVRRSVNVTAVTAKRERLIDIVAGSDRELLRSLDGFRTKGPRAQVLDTDGLRVVHAEEQNEVGEPGGDGFILGLSPLGWAALGLIGGALVFGLKEWLGLRLTRRFR